MSIIGNPIMAGVSGPSASIFVTGLSDTDTVTAVHKKTVQVPNPAAHGLPDGYTELEYIESTGTQYIDVLNFEVASDFGFEIDFAAAYISGQGLFSFHDNDGGTWTRLYDVNNHRYVSRFDNEQYFTPTSDRQIVTLNGSTGDVAIDGVTQFTLSTISNTASGIMCIFGMENLGNHSGLSTGKIYSLKFKTGSDTTHSFIPAKRISDSAIGLYDLVNNAFYTNAGTGTFTAGSEIPAYIEMTVDDKTLVGKWTQKPNPASVVPDGYTQLEYIESTGTQYINTGLTFDTAAEYTIDFTITGLAENQYGNSAFICGTVYGAYWYLQCINTNAPQLIWASYLNNTIYRFTSTSSLNTEYHAVFKNAASEAITCNDLTFTTSSQSYTQSFNYNMLLFATDHPSLGIDGRAKARIMEFSKTAGNHVAQHFVPARRNSDSVLGMYDIANGVFYTNAGTGEFVAGAEVPQTIDGFLIKPIRDLGTWTVTATDGVHTKTQDVLVDVITEYEIEMDYKLWLYRDGDECEDVTGGWSSSGYTTGSSTLQEPTKNNDSVTLYCNTNNYVSLIGTVNPISFKGYSKLKCCTKNVSINGTYAGGEIIFDVQKTTINISSQSVSFVRSSEESECEIDISEYQGTYYVCAKVFNATSKADLTKVWLE